MGDNDWSHLENEDKQALGIHQLEDEPTGKSFDAPGFSAFSEQVKEDFANIKIGTSYPDLVNTVGIPSSVSWSNMLNSESFLIFYYKLSDTRFVTIHFGGNRTISEINGLEDPATSASTTP